MSSEADRPESERNSGGIAAVNILIDGVFLQYTAPNSAEAQGCCGILGRLATEASRSGVSLTILDRGGAPHVDGLRVMAFPLFRNATPAADAFLAQRVCDRLGTDVFVSTGFTTPISTPTLQWLVGEDLVLLQASRGEAASQRDCEIALAFSTYLICSTVAMEAACCERFPGWAEARIAERRDARLPSSDRPDDQASAVASQILALSRQALARASVSREPEFMRKWRKVREIQAAIEVS